MKIAVITGASSGMGREFALQIAGKERFDEIWVIARREERLAELAKELDGVNVRIMPFDLTDPENLEKYKNALEEASPEVSLLVNASGFGRFGRYDQIPLQDCMDMIDLNCKALVAVTQITLPFVPDGGRIVEVDSLSAFQPVPYLNVYAASKAFVLSYSRALKAELRERRIKVMAFCPGWVKTEFFDHAERTSRSAVTFFNRVFTADEVVRCALKCLERGKDVCVSGLSVRLQVLGVKLLPAKLVMNVWLKQQKH